jgi:hypothetical protein
MTAASTNRTRVRVTGSSIRVSAAPIGKEVETRIAQRTIKIWIWGGTLDNFMIILSVSHGSSCELRNEGSVPYFPHSKWRGFCDIFNLIPMRRTGIRGIWAMLIFSF